MIVTEDTTTDEQQTIKYDWLGVGRMWEWRMGWGGGMGGGKCRELYIKCVIVIKLAIKQTLITQLLP